MKEPATDLAVVCAIASSYFEQPIARDAVLIGEVRSALRCTAPCFWMRILLQFMSVSSCLPACCRTGRGKHTVPAALPPHPHIPLHGRCRWAWAASCGRWATSSGALGRRQRWVGRSDLPRVWIRPRLQAAFLTALLTVPPSLPPPLPHPAAGVQDFRHPRQQQCARLGAPEGGPHPGVQNSGGCLQGSAGYKVINYRGQLPQEASAAGATPVRFE
jgi:hypothetical protein